jgi:RND family efflux transporter MFP subunit
MDENRAMVVDAATAGTGSLEQSIRLSGDIVAGRSVRLFAQIPDRLTHVHVDVGDRVRSGQVLARVRNEAVQAGVTATEASLRAARSSRENLRDEYERTQNLHAAGATSNQILEGVRTQLEAVEAQVEQLEAALTQAQVSSQNTLVTAPFAGVIAERYLEAGDLAGPGMPVFRLVNMETVRVEAQISQEQLGQIHLGMPARISVSAYPGEIFTGEIINIAPVLDPMTRMTKIEVGVENPGERLKAGMFADLNLITATVENVTLIPLDALLEEYRYIAPARLEGETGTDREVRSSPASVYRILAGVARLTGIEVGVSGTELVQVVSGLESGDEVVTVGKYQIADSTRVEIRGRTSSSPEGGSR